MFDKIRKQFEWQKIETEVDISCMSLGKQSLVYEILQISHRRFHIDRTIGSDRHYWYFGKFTHARSFLCQTKG